MIHGSDATTTVIVDGLKEKQGYNEEVICTITNRYTFLVVNETFFNRSMMALLPQNGVSDVIPIVKYMKLVC